MPADPDPRVYFAAERTLLAWLRTGLAVMGLGFVVARFGLFLRVMASSTGHAPDSVHHPVHGHVSTILGVSLVGLAVVMMAAAARQYRRFLRTLGPEELPRDYNPAIGIILALSLALIGLGLAVSLLVWTK